MIAVHHLHRDEPLYLNPDLIVTVEATPDTVIALSTGHRHVVREAPEVVVELVRAWRSAVYAGAFSGTGVRALHLIPGGAGASTPSGA
jgi:flagellar protein FlbD